MITSEGAKRIRIEEFQKNKSMMEGQYELVKYLTDKTRSEILYDNLKSIYNSESIKQIGKGKAIKYYFENVQIFINPGDIFADLSDVENTPVKLRHEEYQAYKKYRPNIEDMKKEGVFFADCDFGHTMPDWNVVLKEGITGIIDRAERCLKNELLSEEQRNFYISVRDAYEGILIYAKRLYDKASGILSPNAQFAAKNLKALTEGEPKTLGEAMQLYFLYYTAQHWVEGENVRSLGGVDELLYPYFVHDIDNGICDEKEVRQLICYFLYKWNSMKILANVPFYLCGNTNDLTYMILEEYSKMDIPDPKIHIKCSDKTPDKVYEMIMNSIRKGNNSFLFINDSVVKKALVNIGEDYNDAQNYTVIGCYEPASIGKEIPCTLNGAISMPMAVEVALNNGTKFDSDVVIGIQKNTAPQFIDFSQFYAAVKEQLKYWVEAAMEEINTIERQYPNIIQSPVLSATFNDCMELGKDAYAGGAKYSNSSICAFGMATIVDELIAIKKAVYEEKMITLEQLKLILKNNWMGNEKLRKIMRDKYPKFGNNEMEADELAKDLAKFMSDNINGKANGRGGVYRLGLFSIDWIMTFGKKLGASADGRFSGEPISKNMSASVGMDKKGITGLIHSVTRLDYTLVPNGTVLDLAIHPSVVSNEEGILVMINTLKYYLSEGGFAMHINVVSPDTLKAAQENPDKYNNLQVRLCGWNVYFTDLDIDSQNNLIRSMEREG